MRYAALVISVLGCLVFALLIPSLGDFATYPFLVFLILAGIGIWDLIQRTHNLKRNYPLLANFRYLLEKVRPEIRQYFLESDLDGAPFNRNKRALIYQRAKRQLETRPFGTLQNVYGDDYEWITHSICPTHLHEWNFRIRIGGPHCLQPYQASLLNISAMSFGSLSANAIRALNRGAKEGGFAHDTGEGSISPYHREQGGDLIWELGSGYFGCRNKDGTFSPERFAEQARTPQVKMIEIKLSQGAKPGHGGVLPGPKVTPEIASTRGVPVGVDCVSPAGHSAFSTPGEMMHFIARLRELSEGKPVGFKLCIGHPSEFMGLCKAMLETGILPDFIVIDGSEGGTGAAPLEFTDHIGTPLREGLTFAHNCLLGAGLRDKIKLGASGRIASAFDMARVLALGADWCNAARGFMFALGCVQSLSCHNDKCPTGVATQDPLRQLALDVEDKSKRVHNFHDRTLMALAEIVEATGLSHPREFHRDHFYRRVSPLEVKSFADVYPELSHGSLLNGSAPDEYKNKWARSRADRFMA